MIIKMYYYLKRRNESLLARSHIRLYAAFLNVIKTEWFTVRLQGLPQCHIVLTGRLLARKGGFFLDFVTYNITSQNPALPAVLVKKFAREVKKLVD